MHIVYTNEKPPESYSKSIFLAGPTPRTPDIKSWRPEALAILESFDYDGVVFVPEFRPGCKGEFKYPDIPVWEHKMLDKADCILFWIPRKIETLPAFTTNIEFGLYAHSGKVIVGAPVEAERMKYLWFMADKFRMPRSYNLSKTIEKALEMIGDGALRNGGETDIPLHIWRTNSFQSWYSAQKSAGNRLDGAKIEWIFKVGPNKNIVFYWAIHANIHVVSENRNKINEIVLSRFDISSILLYYSDPNHYSNILNTQIVLVKEFRSPARTEDGFIHELPGGSSVISTNPQEVMAEELKEEVGLTIDPARLKEHGSRQLAGTLSTHQGTLFSYQLNWNEIKWLHDHAHQPHGADLDNPTGERTWIEIKTVEEILSDAKSDWTTIGMISLVLLSQPDQVLIRSQMTRFK